MSLTYLLFHPGLETKISCKDFLSVSTSSKTFCHFLQAVPCVPVGKLEKPSCTQSCVDVNQRLICATVGIHWIAQRPLPPTPPLRSSINAALHISKNILSSFDCTVMVPKYTFNSRIPVTPLAYWNLTVENERRAWPLAKVSYWGRRQLWGLEHQVTQRLSWKLRQSTDCDFYISVFHNKHRHLQNNTQSTHNC